MAKRRTAPGGRLESGRAAASVAGFRVCREPKLKGLVTAPEGAVPGLAPGVSPRRAEAERQGPRGGRTGDLWVATRLATAAERVG